MNGQIVNPLHRGLGKQDEHEVPAKWDCQGHTDDVSGKGHESLNETSSKAIRPLLSQVEAEQLHCASMDAPLAETGIEVWTLRCPCGGGIAATLRRGPFCRTSARCSECWGVWLVEVHTWPSFAAFWGAHPACSCNV